MKCAKSAVHRSGLDQRHIHLKKTLNRAEDYGNSPENREISAFPTTYNQKFTDQ
jgi:hypothetical protein